jgi:Fic family protein
VTENAATGGYEPFASFSAWQLFDPGSTWITFLNQLQSARATADASVVAEALTYALRSAALETGAIEGLYTTNRGVTRTVALQGALWEAELDKLGSDVRGHFEAQLAAFELVLDAATGRFPMTEAWIRDLHATVCAAQASYRVLTEAGWQDRPLEHGRYKTSPNNVTLNNGSVHWYAPPDEVRPEMHRLIELMSSRDFNDLHPILQAAWAHHVLTYIHPFADGNGRVARALASVFLYRAAGVPLVIFSDQQVPYWDSLSDADGGRTLSFSSFIFDRALDTVALVTDRLRAARSPLQRSAAELRSRMIGHGGLPRSEVTGIAGRVVSQIQHALNTQFVELGVSPDTYLQFIGRSFEASDLDPLPYRAAAEIGIGLAFRDASSAIVQHYVLVGLSLDTAAYFAFVVALDDELIDVNPLYLRLASLHPTMSAASETLIHGWAGNLLSNMITELVEIIDNPLT